MLTAEQVLALAPDPSSAKSGRDLATRRKWVSVARKGDVAVWGECQGSGSKPYQTQVDLSEPAFKCSCPSRKFPCKHGIGLLMLLATDTGTFVESDPPAWVTAWLESRAERAEKQAVKKAEQVEKAVDPVAQAKRIAQREERVLGGLDDIEQWLRDLMRRGLANVDLGYKFFDGPAARLVDSQAPGLARMVREMSGIPSSGSGWQDRLVERAGLLYLAIQGYRQLHILPSPKRGTSDFGRGAGGEGFPDGAVADLRTVVGWNYSQEEVLAREGVADRWSVIAQHVEEDDRLQVQRTWLQGERTDRPALILQFAHGSQGFGEGSKLPSGGGAGGGVLTPGSAFDGELAFFPSASPLRALVKSRSGEATMAHVSGHATIGDAIDSYARALASFPWLDRFPVALADVVPAIDGGSWRVVDTEMSMLPIAPRFSAGWRLMALSGGHPVTVCGEWNGVNLLPLGIFAEGRYTSLA